MKAVLGILSLFPLFCSSVCGQATVTALERDFEQIEISQEVTCLRQTLEEVSAELNMQLEVGDELIGTGTTSVELKCAGGSLLSFSGEFRLLLVQPAEGQDCAINLLAGNANVTSENPTGMTSGETTLGSAGTIYEFRVSGEGDGLKQECVVFEGQVNVDYGSRGRFDLSAGEKTVWRRGRSIRRSAVQEEDVERVAGIFARLDASKARLDGARDPAARPSPVRAARQDAYSEFVSLYRKALKRPQDADARLELANSQLHYGNNKEALYHARQAERSATGEAQKADIALTQAVVYSQMGDGQKASQEFRKARQLDPSITTARDIEQMDPEKLKQLIRKPGRKPPQRP